MELADFTRDLTAEADAGLLDRPIGRDKEMSFILKILGQEGKSNALVLGPAGSGKTVIAEGLAFMLANNEIPGGYPRKKVLEVNLTAMNSGAMYVGQFEERVTVFIEKVKNDPSIIVFIDEIHMLMGFGKAGDGSAARDLSQIIKPPLARGQICCLGATTQEEFDTYIAQDSAFVRRFQVLNLEPLERDAVIQILKRTALKNKYVYGIEFTEDSLGAMVDISEQLFPRRHQPDKSLDVLKRLTLSLQENPEISPKKKKKPLKDYIRLLDEELSLVDHSNYMKLREKAVEWLGLSNVVAKTIDLSREEAISLLGPKGKKQ